MSGMRGAYTTGKMRVTVRMNRETVHGGLRRLFTHVFVSENSSKAEVFAKVDNKFPALKLTNMEVTRIRSREWRSPNTLV